MVQKPQYVADAWRETSMILKSNEEMATIEGLSNLYQKVKPTNRKVLSMIQADPQNNSEQAAVDFLKCFVRGMDQAQLNSFLRYATGADVLCVPHISVQFSTLDGQDRPSYMPVVLFWSSHQHMIRFRNYGKSSPMFLPRRCAKMIL